MKIAILLLLTFAVPSRGDVCGSASTLGGLSGDLKQIVSTQGPRDGGVYKVFFGTTRPSHVPLTDGQLMAVGSWGTCSGTVVTGRWVLTANHCQIRVGQRFCVGQYADAPVACAQAMEVHRNPDADMTLVKLTQDLTQVVPGLEPIPLLTEDLGKDWIGEIAEASGYGQQEDGSHGEREFTAEPIVDLAGHELTIDGEGRHGVCFGDSGGPVMVIDSGGVTSVAGNLSWGDPDCLGKDRYTRVDTNRAWLEGLLGPLEGLREPPAVITTDAEPPEEVELPDYTTSEGTWVEPEGR
jgi:hypothetical protein